MIASSRQKFREANLTEQQWRVLRVLADEGEIDPSSLARLALLHAPSVTRILRELADRGLVARSVDPNDGRRSIVAISPEGKALVERFAVHALEVLDTYARLFGSERLERLLDELEALVRAISGEADGRTSVAP